jgi:signal transduction histidine kinase
MQGLNLPISEVVDRLTAHKTLGAAPREELEWIAAHGELRHYEAGDVLNAKTQRVTDMDVLLSGHAAIHVDRGNGRRKVMEWFGGDVAGTLPYSRVQNPPGDSMIEEDADIIAVHADLFPEMIIKCPTITATLVHTMLDRVRHFTSTDWQDEKMVSLGRLAAGLAHELNNPASAVARSAKTLQNELANAEEVSYELGSATLNEKERDLIEALRDGSLIRATTGVFSAIERADREDEILTWLEDHGADTSPVTALAESGVSVDALDRLADNVRPATLDYALKWIAAGYTTRSLAVDIERAASRIYDLVSAVKRFTFMDRATVSEPQNIAQGVTDTVAVLASKARAKSIMVKLEIPEPFPQVPAFGGELNQVWSNLIENALDAVPASGSIVIRATCEGKYVVVRVIDDGPGLTQDDQTRIFDPFYTTKPLGERTGLGLVISRRIIRRHNGTIEVDSVPGRTEFRVTLPQIQHRNA